jgi:hypothetical protein
MGLSALGIYLLGHYEPNSISPCFQAGFIAITSSYKIVRNN